MDILKREDAFAEVASIGNTAARDALVTAMREAGAEAARFSEDELGAFGIVRGKRNILKGSASGPIAAVRTDKASNTVLVILNPVTK